MEINEMLQKLHFVEMKIAREFKRICDKYHIKYYMIAGTLLGAVRHQGFIPWDDDMDFGLLREDYEKFILCCKVELSDEFYLQTWDTDSNYPFSYAKIRMKGTIFVEEFSENSKMMNGIFIDIFPFDNVPYNDKEIKKQNQKYYLYKRLLWIKKGCGEKLIESKGVKYKIFLFFSKFFKYDKVQKKFKNIQTKYNYIKPIKVVADGTYGYYKESIDYSLFFEQTSLEFEGEKFTTFKKYDEYLKYFYGDYLKLPPIEKRKGHIPKKVDFGIYLED